MVQVDKIAMIKYIFAGVFLVFLAGCSFKSVQHNSMQVDANLTVSSKMYENITKDQLLDGVKIVLNRSFNNDIIIDSYRMEINATKATMVPDFIGVDISNDYFYFKVKKEDNNTLQAQISLSSSKGIDEENKIYYKNDHEIYEQFWSRLDYILGLRDDYDRCMCGVYNFLGPYRNTLGKDDKILKKE